jgi:hypothetical protein
LVLSDPFEARYARLMVEVDILQALAMFSVADAVLLLLCLPVGLLLRWVLKRSAPLPDVIDRPWWLKFLVGAVIAAIALALTILPAAAAGGYNQGPGWQEFEQAGESIGFFGMWLMFGVHALMEELLFRGLAMALSASLILALVQRLLRRREIDPESNAPQRAWLATGMAVNLAIAVLFGLAHAFNPNVTAVAVLNTSLVSLVLGHLMWSQASILGAWSCHWLWNGLVVSLGFPVSGVMLPQPIEGFGVSGSRDGLLTGGQFGPEGSLLCTLALTVMLCALIIDTVLGGRTGLLAKVFEG